MGGHHGNGPTNIVDNDNVHIGGNFSGGISNFNNISATKKLILQNLAGDAGPVHWIQTDVSLCVEFNTPSQSTAIMGFGQFTAKIPLLSKYPMVAGTCAANGYAVTGWATANNLGANVFGKTFDTFYPTGTLLL